MPTRHGGIRGRSRDPTTVDKEDCDMPVNASRNRDVRRLLRKAEFDATDQRDKEEFVRDFTDPSILGLKASDAAVAADVLRTAMINRMAAEDVDDDEAPGPERSEAPTDKTDNVELVEDDDDTHPSPDDDAEKPEGLTKIKPDDDADDVPVDGLQDQPFGDDMGVGAPDLGELFQLDREQVGFPDEEDGEVEEEGDSDLPPWMSGGEGEGLEEGEGTSVSLEKPGDEVTVTLPGGGSLELEYKPGKEGPVAPGAATTEEVLSMAQTQRVAAATQPAAQTDVLTQRAQARRAMIAQAQQQTMPEHFDPDTEKKLGDDTSHGGQTFVMEDGKTAVAVPNAPESRDTSTMQNSEGNSLLSWDSSFAGNEIAMMDQGNQMNVGAKDKFTFQDPRSGVFTQTFNPTPIDIPTMGGTDDLWGSKNFGEFDLVTQQPQNTGERITTRRASAGNETMSVFATPEWEYRVARACSEKRCMGGCSNPGSVEPVQCKECGVVYAMCDDCITGGKCPTCTTDGRDVEAQINWDSYCQDAGQRSEVCEDRRGDDVNGDGGFRTQGTQSGTPKAQDARDMKLDAGDYEEKLAAFHAENRQLRAQNERLQVEMARLAKAAEVTLQMVDNGQVLASSGIGQIDEFVSSDMDVPALESLRKIAASLPKQQHETRVASVADAMNMTRTAGVQPIQNAGVFVNPNPTTAYVPQERLASILSEVLSSGMPKEEDFDPETGRQLRRR